MYLFCLGCHEKLEEMSRQPFLVYCDNDECSRYGLLTALGVELKNRQAEENCSSNLRPTHFIHSKNGWPVVLSTGLGTEFWSVYIQKPNGSLKRCTQFAEHLSAEKAEEELNAYTGKTLKRKG